MSIAGIASRHEVYFCPTCGSSSLELPELAGGVTKCDACGWVGRSQELLVTAVTHERGDDMEVIRGLMLELKSVMAKNFATDFGRLLIKWGFMSKLESSDGRVTFSHKELARYLSASAAAIIQSAIETRAALEKESKRGES